MTVDGIASAENAVSVPTNWGPADYLVNIFGAFWCILIGAKRRNLHCTQTCKNLNILAKNLTSTATYLTFSFVPFSTVHVKWFPLSALWNWSSMLDCHSCLSMCNYPIHSSATCCSCLMTSILWNSSCIHQNIIPRSWFSCVMTPCKIRIQTESQYQDSEF